MPDPRTVLIVEDDAPFRRTIAAYLDDCGYRVLEAGDGMAALEVIGREKPDILLTDLRMAGMDGLELIIRVRRQDQCMPVVVITGTGLEQARDEAIRQGATECIRKPICDMGLLQLAIERATATTGAQRGEGDSHDASSASADRR